MIKDIKVVKIEDKTDFSFMTCNVHLVSVSNEVTKKIIDTFEICGNKKGEYWAWTMNTSANDIKELRNNIVDMLNSGNLSLKDN